jgi:hypothetical protein
LLAAPILWLESRAQEMHALQPHRDGLARISLGHTRLSVR